MSRKFVRKTCCFKRDERGVQLVELAIVLPVLVLLFAAAAEFGRYFYEYTTLAKGSRVAARYLVTARTNGDDDPCAKNLVVYGNLAGTGNPIVTGLELSNVSITRRDKDGALITGGVPNTVTIDIVNFQHTPVFDLAGLTKSSTTLAIDVKPSVTMRYLMTQPLIGGPIPCWGS
jgi:Flp pilus assembly protein TadG